MVFRCTKIGFFCQSPFRQAGCTDFCSLAGVQTIENRDFCSLAGMQTVENRDFCPFARIQTIKNHDFCSLVPVQTLKNRIFGPAAAERTGGEESGRPAEKSGGRAGGLARLRRARSPYL